MRGGCEERLGACANRELLIFEDSVQARLLFDNSLRMTLQICAQDHTFVSTTIKGARISNEDTSFSDGRFFSLFDGHGGKHAARVCRDELPDHFCKLLKSGKFSGPAPKPVQVCARCVTVYWRKLRHGRGPSDGDSFSFETGVTRCVCVCVCARERA